MSRRCIRIESPRHAFGQFQARPFPRSTPMPEASQGIRFMLVLGRNRSHETPEARCSVCSGILLALPRVRDLQWSHRCRGKSPHWDPLRRRLHRRPGSALPALRQPRLQDRTRTNPRAPGASREAGTSARRKTTQRGVPRGPGWRRRRAQLAAAALRRVGARIGRRDGRPWEPLLSRTPGPTDTMPTRTEPHRSRCPGDLERDKYSPNGIWEIAILLPAGLAAARLGLRRAARHAPFRCRQPWARASSSTRRIACAASRWWSGRPSQSSQKACSM